LRLTYRAQLVRAFTKVIIEITLALTVLLNIGTCICASTFFIVRTNERDLMSRRLLHHQV
jgi:hypothetical protein